MSKGKNFVCLCPRSGWCQKPPLRVVDSFFPLFIHSHVQQALAKFDHARGTLPYAVGFNESTARLLLFFITNTRPLSLSRATHGQDGVGAAFGVEPRSLGFSEMLWSPPTGTMVPRGACNMDYSGTGMVVPVLEGSQASRW